MEVFSTGGCRNGGLDERIDLQLMMGVVPSLFNDYAQNAKDQGGE